MNDHIELLVPVRTNKILNLCKILLWILAGLFAVVGLYLGFIPMIIAIGVGAGAYFVGQKADIEYEYALTEKEIDIDVIFAKQRRKHVTTIDLTKLEAMFKLNGYRMNEYSGRQLKEENYSSKEESNKNNMYVMIYDGSRKIIIEPDERLYKAIYNIAPHKVHND